MTNYLKNKWIKPLRAGKYKQIKNRLKDHNGHCCMGVLCEISNKLPFILKPGTNYFSIEDFNGIIPEKFLNLIKLERNVQIKAIGMNDSNKSFNEIADYLQEEL